MRRRMITLIAPKIRSATTSASHFFTHSRLLFFRFLGGKTVAYSLKYLDSSVGSYHAMLYPFGKSTFASNGEKT